MPDILGMHVANKPGASETEFESFIGRGRPVTMLDLQVGHWYDRLRRNAPDRLIHVRIYRQYWMDTNPQGLARWLVRHFDFLLDDPMVIISPANEQNIEAEKKIHLYQGQDRLDLYRRIGVWNIEFWNELASIAPARRCQSGWSALADGHDAYDTSGNPWTQAAADAGEGVPDSAYMVPEIKAAIDSVGWLMTHPYADYRNGLRGIEGRPAGSAAYWHMLRPWRSPGTGGSHDPGGALAQFPGKPHFVSECGTFAHETHPVDSARDIIALCEHASRDGRTVGITPFIFWSGDEHFPNRIGKQPELMAELRNCFVQAHAGTENEVGEPQQEYVSYRVKRGDTLWRLGGAEWRRILRTVPMGDPRELEVGMTVLIPKEIADDR